jgi:hypothetical protein
VDGTDLVSLHARGVPSIFASAMFFTFGLSDTRMRALLLFVNAQMRPRQNDEPFDDH